MNLRELDKNANNKVINYIMDFINNTNATAIVEPGIFCNFLRDFYSFNFSSKMRQLMNTHFYMLQVRTIHRSMQLHTGQNARMAAWRAITSLPKHAAFVFEKLLYCNHGDCFKKINYEDLFYGGLTRKYNLLKKSLIKYHPIRKLYLNRFYPGFFDYTDNIEHIIDKINSGNYADKNLLYEIKQFKKNHGLYSSISLIV